ncbi:MAG: hypothetical protein GY913_20590 [Proteobacteria bacterium]|nr:hypothetical protein [Pseudomonadota bacterium]MCP4919307.1 hypothetical protein [Pseudomonadota bacterium]
MLLPLLLAAAGLGALGWFVLQPGPTAKDHLLEMGPLDLGQASRVLDAEQEALLDRITAALQPEYQSQVAALAGLQSQAADLRMEGILWRVLPARGALVPVEMELTVLGQYYDLPILVDGLYRQAWPVEVRRIVAETPKLGTATVQATILCRFHRPPRVDAEWLETEGADLFPDQPDLGGQALTDAARVYVLEAFDDASPGLEAASQANHDLVMMHLPRTLHQLPQSPVGWVEMVVVDGGVVISDEPSD